MQFGFSGHGEPAVARCSANSWPCENELSLSVAQRSWSFSHVPPYLAGCGSIEVLAAPASTKPSGRAEGSLAHPPSGAAAGRAGRDAAAAVALWPAGASEAPAHALVTMTAPP